jgi:F420H(2)-dependent biliverdin reductase
MDQQRVSTERNVWLATMRPNGRPHLVPVWFVWLNAKIYVCMQPGSVKARNLQQQPRVSLALENGDKPIIAEGEARFLPAPFPDAVNAAFKAKFDWDIQKETGYQTMIEVVVEKWLNW